MELQIEVPDQELGPIASHEMWGEVYDRIAALAQQHRSTLVFKDVWPPTTAASHARCVWRPKRG
jgi:Lhr-like helicase